MSDLFREEALDYHARHRGPGELLRLAPRWVSLGYWGLLALVVAGIIVSLVVRVDGERLLFILLGRG